MPIVIRAIAFASGEPCPHAGQYVERFEHEACDGKGYGEFTPDIAKAQRFKNRVAAFEFWRRVPASRKYRGDGLPNRPLTALTTEFVTVPDDAP